MATTEQFSLRWNNYHSNLTSGFHDLLQANDMVDVTLAVEGQFLQAHKLVLSICSPLFKQLFKINPCKHPVVILRDVTYGNLKDILEFMYLGEVNVLRDNLSSFLRTAELLQVKGLTGDDSSDTSSRKDEKLDSICDNDLEQDMQQFSQLIESSESPLMPHYSTPHLSSPPSLPAALSNVKRTKSTGGNSKRSKTEVNSSQSTKLNTKPNTKSEKNVTPNKTGDSEDTEYSDTSHIKTEPPSYGSESDETLPNQDVIKHLLDSNSLTTSMSQDSTSQEHDILLYTVDTKGHVYCPYCYRKFVNRYNLKVHIRDKHDNNPINLDCIICGKTMRNRSCLRVHLYHHRKQQLMQADQGDTSVE